MEHERSFVFGEEHLSGGQDGPAPPTDDGLLLPESLTLRDALFQDVWNTNSERLQVHICFSFGIAHVALMWFYRSYGIVTSCYVYSLR